MLDNTAIIKLEIEVMAQKLLQQYIIHNEQIEKQVEAGIKNAFENFDFEKEVEKIAKRAIEDSIKSSINYGSISNVIKKKSDEILNNIADKYFENVKNILSAEQKVEGFYIDSRQ